MSVSACKSSLVRPTWIEVDLDAIVHNYQSIHSYVAPAQVMPVLKANAYGHGLVEVARALEDCGAPCFGVAFLEEAVTLREAGIRCPILALGGISGRQIEGFIEYGVDCTASSVDKLATIVEIASRLGKAARVHLKIDTGMERIGTHYYSAEKLLRAACAPGIEVVGIFTHCAKSETTDTSYTQLQLQRFESVLILAESILPQSYQRHMANSGAILSLRDTHLDLVRPGLLLYGYKPQPLDSAALDLRPAMKLRSEVVYFKVVEAGAGVSYDHTWYAPKQTRIVTIPLGYGDGYSRSFSNCASVLIRGKRYQVVGRVCMDQFLVDIGDGSAFNGDEVVLLGEQGAESINLHELAQWAHTDPREVLVALNARIPRVFVGAPSGC